MNNTKANAHIARDKNRLKSYGEVVYLRDKDNFEIELFNGYSRNVMAKIWINEELISHSGLVLKPGERYFLERFIDTNNKFLFETYDVDGSKEAQEAIKNNGHVRVEFYKEVQKPLETPRISRGITWTNPGYYDNTGGFQWSGGTTLISDTSTHTYFSNSNTFTAGSLSGEVNLNASLNSDAGTKSIETGRIEMGESSNQSFSEVQMDFEIWASDKIEWKLLPESQKPVEATKIRSYCPSCGTRIRKSTWKFCPNCGEDLK